MSTEPEYHFCDFSEEARSARAALTGLAIRCYGHRAGLHTIAAIAQAAGVSRARCRSAIRREYTQHVAAWELIEYLELPLFNLASPPAITRAVRRIVDDDAERLEIVAAILRVPVHRLHTRKLSDLNAWSALRSIVEVCKAVDLSPRHALDAGRDLVKVIRRPLLSAGGGL
jgi:hypothetical protein